jgi:hypothetical protein
MGELERLLLGMHVATVKTVCSAVKNAYASLNDDDPSRQRCTLAESVSHELVLDTSARNARARQGDQSASDSRRGRLRCLPVWWTSL